jgi:hypothetical protein
MRKASFFFPNFDYTRNTIRGIGCSRGMGFLGRFVGLSFGVLVRILGCVFLGFWLGYLCILSCVLRGAFFDIYNITYQKKKKKKETPFNQYMDKCAWHVKEETNKQTRLRYHVKSVKSLDYQVERPN